MCLLTHKGMKVTKVHQHTVGVKIEPCLSGSLYCFVLGSHPGLRQSVDKFELALYVVEMDLICSAISVLHLEPVNCWSMAIDILLDSNDVELSMHLVLTFPPNPVVSEKLFHSKVLLFLLFALCDDLVVMLLSLLADNRLKSQDFILELTHF